MTGGASSSLSRSVGQRGPVEPTAGRKGARRGGPRPLLPMSRRRRRRAWTDSETRRLLHAIRRGRAVPQIAAALDRPEQTISRRITLLREEGRLPPPRRNWSNGEVERLIAAVLAGQTRPQIAADLGRRCVA